MNRGYAFGFLIVLLVLALGMYVAYTSFVSSRETLRSQATAPTSTRVEQAARPSSTSLPPLSITPTARLTVTVPITVSVVTATPPSTAAAPPATEPPAPSQPPPAPPPTNTPPPQASPPTPVPAVTYQFRLAGPPTGDPNYIAGSCYLHGTVRDAAGNGLEGVQVQALNKWLPPLLSVTKGEPELGLYDIPINCDLPTWDVVVLDAAGSQISTKVQVQFDPDVANAFRIDWRRTY